MSWIKGSDTAINNPIVLAPLVWKTDPSWPVQGNGLLAALLYGMVQLCATHNAGGASNYVILDQVIAGLVRSDEHWRTLADLAERAGYWERLPTDDGYLLIDDSDGLFHIRLATEKAWEATRKRDAGNYSLTVPVRLRDGDGCRYCGCIVNWEARRGSRYGTYDHRTPGQGARSPEDLVVSCGGCNGRRGNDPDALPLLDVPAEPYYGQSTVDYLRDNGKITVPLSSPQRPRTRKATATSDLATSQTTPSTRPGQPDTAPSDQADSPAPLTTPTTPRPGNTPDTAPSDQATSPAPLATPTGHRASTETASGPAGHRAPRPVMPKTPRSTTLAAAAEQPKPRPAETADRRDTGSGSAGSGRVRVGSGSPDLPPPTDDQAQQLPKRRRGRRGKAGRPK